MPPTSADASDDELLRRIGAGDRHACTLLVDRHLARMHALAARVLGDEAEAEDVAQEVFIKVWEQAARWRPDGGARFGTWLHQVCLNACRDRLRRRRESASLDAVAEPADHRPGPEARAQADSVGAQVRAALDALPERQREALVLCHYQELPQAEAAEVLGVSVDAIESLLARGRRALRERLAGERASLAGDDR